MDRGEAIVRKSNIIKSPHGFSTRKGGVSKGIFDSLNLGMNRGDDIDDVKENWRRFLEACCISNDEFVCGKQVHGDYVHIADESVLRPAYGEGWMADADGYVTNKKNVPLAVFTADCVPVLLEDIQGGVVAAVHCGWRSTVADIGKETIDKMVTLGAKPENICVAIGPAICRKCFQVGQEVIEAVCSLLGLDAKENIKDLPDSFEESVDREILFIEDKENPGKYFLDLRLVVKKRFMQLGVSENHIEISRDCTMCQPEDYWSHRYTGGIRGSQANIIELI